METYETLRQFADSWGLLFLFVFFVGAVLFVLFRPGAERAAEAATQIPFKEDE